MTGTMGSWDGETARVEMVARPNMWERRTDLSGVTITATSKNYSSFHFLHNPVQTEVQLTKLSKFGEVGVPCQCISFAQNPVKITSA